MIDRVNQFAGTFTHNEVIVRDHYRLKQLPFVPDLIVDIGANVGIFTAWARHCFPAARIVSVEPESENYAELCRVADGVEGITPINAAIGTRPMFFRHATSSGSHGFKSVCPAFPLERIKVWPETDVQVMTVAELIDRYIDGGKVMVKIDIEGAEASIIVDSASTEVLRAVDYIAMELHFWAGTASIIEEAAEDLLGWVGRFRYTHAVEIHAARSGGMAWMTRQANPPASI